MSVRKEAISGRVRHAINFACVNVLGGPIGCVEDGNLQKGCWQTYLAISCNSGESWEEVSCDQTRRAIDY
eukprot:4027516-Karenia_brevis.AAC.1